MSLARHVTINKLDHRGRTLHRYPGEVTYRDDSCVVARCVWGSGESHDLGPFSLMPGDIFVEFYYPHEWFNVFAIYDVAGILKGWYCNVTAPVEIAQDQIRWRDMALDLLVLPDGEQTLLDADEFDDLCPAPELRVQAEGALRTMRRWLEEGQSPFVRR